MHLGIISNNIMQSHNFLSLQALYHLERRFEPEGILGTLNSVVLCYLGAQAGRTLLFFKGRHTSIVSRLTVWGFILVSERGERGCTPGAHNLRPRRGDIPMWLILVSELKGRREGACTHGVHTGK